MTRRDSEEEKNSSQVANNNNNAKQIEAQGEGQQKKLPYPKSVFFIVGNEFCERFSYYGMKAVLSIYLKSKLHFSEDTATVIYHAFAYFCYFTPIFGALIADQFWGKFKTIMYISLIYVLGHLLKTAAAIPALGVPPVEFSLIGLALIAIGTGGIKPCVAAFGGDQFTLPEQERELQTFFSIFYFAINFGSLISTFLTPILRQDVKCFGDETCYSLAFGVPAALMLVATVILAIGKPAYKMRPPQGNILTSVVGSSFTALKNKITGSGPKKDHWLDYAADKYPRDLIEDTKILMNVLYMFLPLPLCWALYALQGSRWTFQAARMNGVVGGSTIKPDQIQLINPALVLFLIPLFDRVIYPAFAKINFLVKPLQRMGTGGILVGVSFIVSGFLELSLMPTYDRIPEAGESHIHIMNSLNCPISARLSNGDGSFNQVIELDSLSNHVWYELESSVASYDIEVRPGSECSGEIQVGSSAYSDRFGVSVEDHKVSGVVVSVNPDRTGVVLTQVQKEEKPKKEENGNSFLKVIIDATAPEGETREFWLKAKGSDEIAYKISPDHFNGEIIESDYVRVRPGLYEAYLGGDIIGIFEPGMGGVRTVFAQPKKLAEYTLTKDNLIHMLWLVPQYIIITTGEIMFSVTGLEFAYSQAPETMKSVLQAAWLLTTAFGNVIVIIIAEAKIFDEQASEFFMFAALLFVDVLIFAWMAYGYKYVDMETVKEERRQREALELQQRPSSTSSANATTNGVRNDGYSGSTDF